MNSNDYKKFALTLDRPSYEPLREQMNGPELRLVHATMGISGEAGELLDAVKKHVFYRKPLDVDNVKEEIGDIMWYAAIALDAVGSSFEEVMALNQAKLSKRYSSGSFSEKQAQERADKQNEG